MDLHPAIALSRLTLKPRLSTEERTRFRILTRAYRILRDANSDAADDVREEALKIMRRRYHTEFDAMHRHQRLDLQEWDVLKSYFPVSYHRSFFSTSRYGHAVNAYLHAAERTYNNVSIRCRDDGADYVVVGWEPGRKIPSVLARMYAAGTAAPNIHQIKQIVKMRRSYWQSSKFAMVGTVVGAILGFILEFKYQLFQGTDAQQLVTPVFCLLGLLSSIGLTWLQNMYKRRQIQATFPHLRIAN